MPDKPSCHFAGGFVGGVAQTIGVKLGFELVWRCLFILYPCRAFQTRSPVCLEAQTTLREASLLVGRDGNSFFTGGPSSEMMLH